MKLTDVRAWIALTLIAAFLIAYFLDPTPEMRAVLQSSFTAAIAYYLCSSKGAAENRDVLNEVARRAGGVS
jgi:phage gp36-like protein